METEQPKSSVASGQSGDGPASALPPGEAVGAQDARPPTAPTAGADAVHSAGTEAAPTDAKTPPQPASTSDFSTRDFSTRDWLAVAKGAASEMGENELTLVAAGVAFYAFLAIFPMIAALVALYGFLLDPQTLERQLAVVQEIAPPGGYAILESQLRGIAAAGRTQLGYASIISLLITLWTARAGVGALIRGLNIVFKVPEKRGIIVGMIVPYALTVLLLLVAVLALASVVVLPGVIAAVEALSPVGMSLVTEYVIRFARWPILLGALVLAIGLLYRYGPAEPRPRFRWLSHGAVFAILLWIAGSALFSYYVRNFGTYNETYGSLGAIVGLLMWLYLSALIVLIGGEINAQIEFRIFGEPADRDPAFRKSWRKVSRLRKDARDDAGTGGEGEGEGAPTGGGARADVLVKGSAAAAGGAEVLSR
ncbi:MAG: YihY/virulence factor BrkB family protein [Pseudomonadota bacterium]